MSEFTKDVPGGPIVWDDDPLLEAPTGELVEVCAGVHGLVHVLQYHVRALYAKEYT